MFWNKKIDSKGKAILITGCDSGFGNRLALRLNSYGFRVYATVLDPNSMGSQELFEKSHFKDIINIIQMDVTDQQQIDDCFNIVNNELQVNGEELWALVNNAGVFTFGHLEWGSFDEYKRLFDVNLFGAVRVTRKFIPLLRQTKGRIVMMASLGGRVTTDLLGVYCMTKSALISFSDSLRREMREFRIKVVTIEPAVFRTAMFRSFEESFEHNWRNTDESVRQIYGQYDFESYVKQQKKRVQEFGDTAAKDLDLVVNDMLSALRDAHPCRCYRPEHGIINKFFAQFIDFIPQILIDKYFDPLNKGKPELITNNNK